MALNNKFIYRLETKNNSQQGYKSRLTVKVFSQEKGIDFEEVFSPVVKMSYIQVILGLVVFLNLEIE